MEDQLGHPPIRATKLVKQTLATLESLPIRKEKKDTNENSENKMSNQTVNKNPCETAWQQKFLKLDCYHQAIQRMASQAEAWVSRVTRNDTDKSLLIMAGETGVGKSKTGFAIYEWVDRARFDLSCRPGWKKEKSLSALALRWPEAVDEIRAKRLWPVHDGMEVDVLFLDDVGADDDPFKEAADKLCQIMTRRERMFTVITTNIAPQNWEERFDTRINDRFWRNSVVVDLTGVQPFTTR